MATTEADIYAVHVLTGEELRMTDVERIAFKGGGNTTKHHVIGQTGTPEGESSSISLIQRDRAGEYIAAWVALRGAGLPVVPEVYLQQLPGVAALVTDLKHGGSNEGSELYGKSMAMILAEPERRVPFRRRPEVDGIFLDLTAPKRLARLAEAALAFGDVATEHGISLPSDEIFELHVRLDGTGSIVLVDIDETNTNPCLPDTNRKRAKDNFLLFINKIRRNLIDAPRT